MGSFAKMHFVGSFPWMRGLPRDGRAEVAFIGRSNAGKSSVLNTLCKQNKLAKTSRTPGRTQAFNVFDLEDVRIIDCPGYGYAKVPKALKIRWEGEYQRYLEGRDDLVGLVLIMDARHPFQTNDMLEIHHALLAQRQVHIVLNKADKLKTSEKAKVLREAEQRCIMLSTMLSCQLYSTKAAIGREQLTSQLSAWFSDVQRGDLV